MKGFTKFWLAALLGLGMMLACPQTEAQGFGLLVTASPSPVGVSNSLTYTIITTNLNAGGIPELVTITNTLPASAQFQSANNPFGTYVTNGNTVIFSFPNPIVYGGSVQVTVTALPTTAGSISDSVVVISGDFLYSASTNVVTQVTNTVVAQADVAVTMTVPASAVYTNDWMVYGVSVTNNGPNDAPGIFLTNTLPPGVGYKSVSPSNKTFTVSIQSSNVIFNLGTLTNGAFRNFLLTVQPTNAGALPFVSVVSTNNSVLDPNLANNLASNNITVLSYPASQLTAVTNSTQQYDSQNGLVEQSILVSNAGPNAVAAVRVVVTGLTKQQLFNSWGTNNGNPFVVYDATLNTNQSVNLLLQFFATNWFPFTNSQLNPFAVTNVNLAPPAAVAISTNLSITRIVELTNSSNPLTIGSMLIEWPSLTNRTYTVVYSDNVWFTNAMMAMPRIVAPANQTQWIDYGPPATVSAPLNSSNRFYRVFLNP